MVSSLEVLRCLQIRKEQRVRVARCNPWKRIDVDVTNVCVLFASLHYYRKLLSSEQTSNFNLRTPREEGTKTEFPASKPSGYDRRRFVAHTVYRVLTCWPNPLTQQCSVHNLFTTRCWGGGVFRRSLLSVHKEPRTSGRAVTKVATWQLAKKRPHNCWESSDKP